MLEIFKPDPLTAFANRIKKDLGLNVIFRGRKIRSDYSMQPPTVYFPNLEKAREEDIEILKGLCLFEAARVRFLDTSIAEDIKDYPTKYIFTSIHDEYVLRAIDSVWDGAREAIVNALIKGREWIEEELANDAFRQKSFIKAKHIVRDVMAKMRDHNGVPFNPDDEAQVDCLAENMESRRVALLWFDEKLGCDFVQSPFIIDWAQHPWKPVFDEIATGAKSCKEALGQAVRIVERLGINPNPIRQPLALEKKAQNYCADFERPVDEARALVAEAEAKQTEAENAIVDHETKLDAIASEVTLEAQQTPEYDAWQEAEDDHDDANQIVKDKRNAIKKLYEKKRPLKGYVRDAKRTVKKAEQDAKKASKDLAKLKKQVAGFKPLAHDENAVGPDLDGRLRFKDALKGAYKPVEKRRRALKKVDRANKALAKRAAELQEADDKITQETNVYNEMKETREAKLKDAVAKQDAYSERESKVRQRIMKTHEKELLRLQQERMKATNAARYATNKANDLLRYIQNRDADVEAPLAPGATEMLVAQSVAKYKDQSVLNEFGGTEDAEDDNAKLDDKFSFADELPPKKYMPFTREYDQIVRVEKGENAAAEYQKLRDEMTDIIERAKDNLKRLYTPKKTRIKTNRRQGRFDSRHGVRVILAGKGLPIDCTRVFREIKTVPNPRVAVSLLLDCSRSMDRIEGVSLRGLYDAASEDPIVPIHEGEPTEYNDIETSCGACIWVKRRNDKARFYAKTIEHPYRGTGKTPKDALRNLQDQMGASEFTRRRLAQKSAVALAEVMRALNIPFEVLGHTTNTEKVPSLDLDGEDPMDNSVFSRYAPFKGYVFKPFDTEGAPHAVCNKVDAQDNLDGEAVQWAAQRLARRSERTKILIVLSDGFPSAKFSHKGELQRHLYGICKQVEAYEKHGMFLWGLGIKTDEVKGYFKNANVIQDANELPEATLGIVQHILINLTGTMG